VAVWHSGKLVTALGVLYQQGCG